MLNERRIMAETSVIIRLGARVGAATAGIKSVYRGLDSLVQKASSLSVIRFGGLISMATAGLGIGGIASQVLKLGANAEKSRQTFQTMLGSVEKGDAIMAQMTSFSNSTPYSTDQVQKAAKTLLAFGVDAGNVATTMRKVGDVAAGSGKDFNELAAIYGKVFAKGKADSESLNQMVEAGIPIVKLLGQQYNKSGDEIYDMASKGMISAKAISAAFDTMSGKGGVYAGMMEKQSQTLEGMWGALVGTLEDAASNIGEAIAPLVKQVLAYFQGWADELAAMSRDGRMVEYLATVAQTAISMAASTVKGFIRIKEYGSAAFLAVSDIGSAIWDGIQGTALLCFVGIIKGFNHVWEQAKAVATLIGRVFRMSFNALASVVASFFAGVVNVALKAVNAVIGMLNKIPGVKLDLAEKPGFVKGLEEYAKEAGEKAAADFKKVASGQDFKDAYAAANQKNRQYAATEAKSDALIQRSTGSLLAAQSRFETAKDKVEKGSRAVDAFAENASKAVSKWQADAQATQARQAAAERTKIQSKQETEKLKADTKGIKQDKIKTDALTKIGLYGNFGAGQIKSIDKERNNLLKEILHSVGRINTQGAVLA